MTQFWRETFDCQNGTSLEMLQPIRRFWQHYGTILTHFWHHFGLFLTHLACFWPCFGIHYSHINKIWNDFDSIIALMWLSGGMLLTTLWHHFYLCDMLLTLFLHIFDTVIAYFYFNVSEPWYNRIKYSSCVKNMSQMCQNGVILLLESCHYQVTFVS